MNNKVLSVIIVSYNNIEIIKNCLDSIKKYNDISDELEVIISDNSINMDLFQYIKLYYPWVTIIKNNNCGFGAGNNRGVEISNGKYLLFLNPDTILIEPIFKFAIDSFETNEKLAMFGVKLVDKSGNGVTSFCMYDIYSVFSRLRERYYQKRDKFKDKNMFICGADIFIRKSVFIEAGMFDENIFMYKEEADLVKRVKLYASEKVINYFNKKRIIHLEGGTEENDSNTRMKIAQRLVESDKYYAKKWDISFNKLIKSRMAFCRFKVMIFTLLFKKDRVQQEKQLLRFYKSKLN